MFHRSQDKQQGFAKEQKAADAQLATLRQIGLIGPDKKGFTSAWGGIEPITSARQRPPSKQGPKSSTNHTITAAIGGEPDERTFPEKGESTSFNLITHYFIVGGWHRLLCDEPVREVNPVALPSGVVPPIVVVPTSLRAVFVRQLPKTDRLLTHRRPFHRGRNNSSSSIAAILHFHRVESITRSCSTSEHDLEFWHDECGQEPHPAGTHLCGE